MLSMLAENVKKSFSMVPQQVYILSDGYDRNILISSLACHNVGNSSHVSFNLIDSEKNKPFFTDSVYSENYYVHALSGKAAELLAKDVRNLKTILRKGDDMFTWTMTLRTDHKEYVLGKLMIIARVIDVDCDQDKSGVTTVYQNRKFYQF